MHLCMPRTGLPVDLLRHIFNNNIKRVSLMIIPSNLSVCNGEPYLFTQPYKLT